MCLSSKQTITALILAGGQGRRMGGRDKGLLEFNGQPLIAHVLHAIAPQVGKIIISANRNQSRYAEWGYPVLSDALTETYQGPLAGILTGLKSIETPLLLVLPCDSPMIHSDVAQRLLNGLTGSQADIAVAHDGTRSQSVHALMRHDLLSSLEDYLAQGHRRVDQWYAQHHWVHVDFSDQPEMFRNLNTPDDWQQLSTN